MLLVVVGIVSMFKQIDIEIDRDEEKGDFYNKNCPGK